MTRTQHVILRNALGLTEHQDEFRNYYAVDIRSDNYPQVKAMVDAGLIFAGRLVEVGSKNYRYYHATEAGKVLARLPFVEEAEARP